MLCYILYVIVEAQKGKSGLDENDQKFLAITFGSATAALVIILLIIVISFCRKKQPRYVIVTKQNSSTIYDLIQ